MYTEPRWDAFDPAVIVVVMPPPVVIDGFVLIDVISGDRFVRPAGSDGAIDANPEAAQWQLGVNATSSQMWSHVEAWVTPAFTTNEVQAEADPVPVRQFRRRRHLRADRLMPVRRRAGEIFACDGAVSRRRGA